MDMDKNDTDKNHVALRNRTAAEHRLRLNKVLRYIQQNLDGALSLDVMADIACFSPFHFHRIFTAYMGETVADYVRRLRLERAATRLCYYGEAVTDAALAAGYETPAAFARAFRHAFGTSPTEYKANIRSRFCAAAVPRADSRGPVREGVRPAPEIRTLPEQRVLFVRRTGPCNDTPYQAWDVLWKFAYRCRLMKPDTRMIGILHDCPDITAGEKLRYDACITVEGPVAPEGEVCERLLSGGRYAVFLHKGDYGGMLQTYQEICTCWYPSSGLKLRDVESFEVYLNRDPRRTKPQNLRTEIYIPVE